MSAPDDEISELTIFGAARRFIRENRTQKPISFTIQEDEFMKKRPSIQEIRNLRSRLTDATALNAELVTALEAFVKACDSAPPLELMAKISDACDKARAALKKARS